MTRGGRHLVAAAASLGINAILLLLLVAIGAATQPEARATAEHQVTIDPVAPPPPRRRPRAPAPRRAPPRTPPLPPALNLPSGIQAPELLGPGLDQGSMLQAMITGDLASSADLILEEDQVDEPPQVVSRTMPVYPPAALDRDQEGQVTLRLLIDADGAVRRVQVLSADPPGVFEGAAEDAVRRWRYTPAVYQGRRVASWYRQRVLFRLR